MKHSEAETGQYYMARVSGRIVPVLVVDMIEYKRINRTRKEFECINVATGSTVYRSARQLRDKANKERVEARFGKVTP